jgi:hypothetical protein
MNWRPKIIYNSTTITFDTPPQDDPLNETVKAETAVAISASGVQQINYLYTVEEITVNWALLGSTLLNSLRTFYEDWACKGFEFKYYTSSDEITFNTYTLVDGEEFSPRRIAPDGSNDFYYDVSLRFRRVK